MKKNGYPKKSINLHVTIGCVFLRRIAQKQGDISFLN